MKDQQVFHIQVFRALNGFENGLEVGNGLKVGGRKSFYLFAFNPYEFFVWISSHKNSI